MGTSTRSWPSWSNGRHGWHELASAILGDADDADAALDDWLVAIWRALPSLRDVGRFEGVERPVACTGCRRRIRERSRQRSRLAPLPLAEDPSWTSGCDPGAAIADRDALARAFDEIAVEDRAALVLHHLEGYALAEIAERLEMPVGMLKVETVTGACRSPALARGSGSVTGGPQRDPFDVALRDLIDRRAAGSSVGGRLGERARLAAEAESRATRLGGATSHGFEDRRRHPPRSGRTAGIRRRPWQPSWPSRFWAGMPDDRIPPSSGAPAGGSAAASNAGAPGSLSPAPPTPLIPTPEPTPWTSLTWRPVGSREVVSSSGPNHYLTDAVAWGGGVVAVGYDFEPDRITGRIWRSLDGADWTEVTGGPPYDGIAVEHVYSLGGRLVATGRDRTAELAGAQNDPGQPVAFGSSDGVTWTPVTDASSPWLGDSDRQVASGGTNVLVLERGVARPAVAIDRLGRHVDVTPGRRAVRCRGDGDGPRPGPDRAGLRSGPWCPGRRKLHPTGPAGVAAAWTSPDGQRWAPATVDAPGISLGAIGVGADGLVAFGDVIGRGTGIRLSMRAFQSADGASWEPIDLPANQLMRMVSDGTRIIVVDIDSNQPARVRESFDGRTWSELPSLGVDARATPTPASRSTATWCRASPTCSRSPDAARG